MPIKHANPPAPNFEELKANLSDVHPDPSDHTHHIPHKVYNMSLNDLLAGKRFAAAQLVGWRYIFRGEDQQSYVAEISVDEATGEHAFLHINSGEHVDNFIALYDRIHAYEPVLERDYEINILRVPACYVMAVWFKATDHSHEFLAPLAPVHSNFEANRPYEADEFMDLLEVTAREMADNVLPAEPAEDMVDPPADATADDFTRIYGIDAETAKGLKQLGIRTFNDLLDNQGGLLELLRQERFVEDHLDWLDRTSGPEGLLELWVRQAEMAAADDWASLREFQNELRAEIGI